MMDHFEDSAMDLTASPAKKQKQQFQVWITEIFFVVVVAILLCL
jgi:hypothetical protein